MTEDRVRGAVLYGCAAVLLVAGATWWWRAAPREVTDPQAARWTQAVQELLPDEVTQVDGRTMALGAGVAHQVQNPVPAGPYRVRAVCAGGSGSAVFVRIELSGGTAEMQVQCSAADHPVDMAVSLVTELRMTVNVTNSGPVVFRYALVPGS